jgi:hypothetical protein
MVPNKVTQPLADRIARVLVALDLRDVPAEDIDAFLDSLAWEPFSHDKVKRILRKARIEPVAKHDETSGNHEGQQNVERKASASTSKRTSCRLTFEQLDWRILPSQMTSPFGGRVVDAWEPSPPDYCAVVTTGLWHDRATVVVTEGAKEWGEGADSVQSTDTIPFLPVETLNCFFAGRVYAFGTDAGGQAFSGDEFTTGEGWDPGLASEAATVAPLPLAG